MRIAVMSDIHGNLEAFAQSVDDIKRQKIDGIVNLGDAIGYGPQPEEVLNLLETGAYRIFSANTNWLCWIRNIVAIFQPKRYAHWNRP